MARIYVGTYAKYNDGNLFGAWLDLEDYSDKDEFIAACLMLHRDEDDPELMFQDWEDIPTGMVSESSVNESVWEWLELDDDDKELLKVYQEDIDSTGDIEKARESFFGKYDKETDWAAEYWEETGLLQSIPQDLQGYIDYESYAHDAKCSGDWSFIRHEGDVWVFRSN